MQHHKQAPNDGVWGCTVLFLSARQVAIRRTAYHTKLVFMAPTTGPQPAHHLGMCAGKLDPAWDLVCQAPATLFKWISAPMCCRIAHGEGAEGSFQLLDVQKMPTGRSQGCQILASIQSHDVVAVSTWYRCQHLAPEVVHAVQFANCVRVSRIFACENALHALRPFPWSKSRKTKVV